MRPINIKNINAIYYFLILAAGFCLTACNQKEEEKKSAKVVDYIKKIEGPSDTIPAKAAQKGEVLIAYSDCYTCHAIDKRAKGPAFKDIAKRYPVQQVYIDLLAQKILQGGFGSWGYPVMSPHPNVSVKDSELMVAYILSLKEK